MRNSKTIKDSEIQFAVYKITIFFTGFPIFEQILRNNRKMESTNFLLKLHHVAAQLNYANASFPHANLFSPSAFLRSFIAKVFSRHDQASFCRISALHSQCLFAIVAPQESRFIWSFETVFNRDSPSKAFVVSYLLTNPSAKLTHQFWKRSFL